MQGLCCSSSLRSSLPFCVVQRVRQWKEDNCQPEIDLCNGGIIATDDIKFDRDYICSDTTSTITGVTMMTGTTLDCNGHAISCDGCNYKVGAINVYGDDATIKNCNIKGHFKHGISSFVTGYYEHKL